MSRAVTHPVAIAAVNAVWISLLFLVVVVAMTLSNIEEKMKEQLESYVEVFSTNDPPIACQAQLFPFFYSADGGAVNVTDHDDTDWDSLREAAERDGELQPSPYDPSTLIAGLPCGVAHTPIAANQVTPHPRAKNVDLQLTGYDFKLRLARDPEGKSLYILGHIGSPRQEIMPGQLRLRLDYADLTHQYFILESASGNMRWKPEISYYSGSTDGEMLLEATGRHGVEFEGTWWDSGTPERKETKFEIRLDNVKEVTAFDIAAEKLDEANRVQFWAGPRYPVPLHEELEMYQLTRNLPRNVDYELYVIPDNRPPVLLTKSRVLGGQAAEVRSPSRVGGWLQWFEHSAQVLSLASRLVFYVNGYEPCPIGLSEASPETETCFLSLDPGRDLFPFRLRRGAFVEVDRSDDEGLVFVEETPYVREQDLVVAAFSVALIVLLIMFLAYMNRRRKEALDRRSRALDALTGAHKELDQRRSELEQMNRALANYAGIFIHEGRTRLVRINELVKNVLGIANLKGSTQEKALDKLFVELTARLRQSIRVFHYREIVREKIATNGDRRFFLIESVEGIMDDYDDITFDHPFEGRTGPGLSATGLDDPKKDDSPDLYFVQAMENVIANAVRYRTRGSKITISLETEDKDVIIRVSNQGPTVPEDKLDSVFEFGMRVSGAGRRPVETEEDEGAGHTHFGVGLFITRQIIEGYQGACRMENKPNGTGVIVTLRVPCR